MRLYHLYTKITLLLPLKQKISVPLILVFALLPNIQYDVEGVRVDSVIFFWILRERIFSVTGSIALAVGFS